MNFANDEVILGNKWL